MKTRNKILPTTISEAEMARSTILTIAVVVLVLAGFYLIDPTLFGLLGRREGFAETMSANSTGQAAASAGAPQFPGLPQEMATTSNPMSAGGDKKKEETSGFVDASGEGFADLADISGPASFGSAEGPAGCYPRDQLTPGELLPKDQNSVWAQQNPMGTGSLKGKNFLSAGALIGINTVGQTLRNANYQLRSEPPNPQVPVSVFNNSTIEPDSNRRDMEIN